MQGGRKRLVLPLLFIVILSVKVKAFNNPTTVVTDTTTVDTLTVTPTWVINGNFAVTFSQISLTNWVAGGENAISGNGATLITASYSKGKNKWDNTLDIGYGLTRQGNDKQIKNEDRIDISSIYGRNASKKWYYSSMIGFKTQFAKGYKYPNDSTVISNFMSPAYIQLSVGMNYKPNNLFNVMISPAAGKLTIVNDTKLANKGAFGVTPAIYDDNGVLVEPGKNTRIELGGSMKILYNAEFWEKKVGFRSKLEFFSNYMDKPQNIDISWDLTLDLRITTYITARAQTWMLYDDDQKIEVKDRNGNAKKISKLQLKEMLGVGFTYKF